MKTINVDGAGNLTGTIFIVDISGYSNFVSKTENEAGAMIICDLLKVLITQNKLDFNICEIEGDAILFYKYGYVYQIESILNQFEAMLSAFNDEVEELKTSYPQVDKLSIKLIVHHGIIGQFSVNGFNKLYGRPVVEAHRLLKNHIGSHTYALITDEYLNQQNSICAGQQQVGIHLCEIYDVGKICFTYFNY